MPIIQKTIGGLKRMFGVREIVGGYQFIKDTSESVFSPDKPVAKSVNALKLSSEQLAMSYSRFKLLFLLAFSIFLLGILYCVYNIIVHHYLPALVSFCFSVMCLSLAFRYNFWMVQIKTRRLGLSFKEWADYITGKRKGV
jgi:hypothetical protein